MLQLNSGSSTLGIVSSFSTALPHEAGGLSLSSIVHCNLMCCRMGGSGDEHPFSTDPTAMAVLSAFRQVLRNTQGIIIDSGEGSAAVVCTAGTEKIVAECCIHGAVQASLLIMPAAAAPCCSALASHAWHLEQGFLIRCEELGGLPGHGMRATLHGACSWHEPSWHEPCPVMLMPLVFTPWPCHAACPCHAMPRALEPHTPNTHGMPCPHLALSCHAMPCHAMPAPCHGKHGHAIKTMPCLCTRMPFYATGATQTWFTPPSMLCSSV